MFPYPFLSEKTRKKLKNKQKYRKRYKKLVVNSLTPETKLIFEPKLPECLLIEQDNKEILRNSTIQELIYDNDSDEEYLSKLPYEAYSVKRKENIEELKNIRLPHDIPEDICQKLQSLLPQKIKPNNNVLINIKKKYFRKKYSLDDVMIKKGFSPCIGRLSHCYTYKSYRQVGFKKEKKLIKKKNTIQSFKMPVYEYNCCLYHNGEVRCTLPRVKSIYCRKHNEMFGKIAGNIIQQEELLLFGLTNPCNVAEPRTTDFENLLYTSSDIHDTNTYIKYLNDLLTTAVENLAAKELLSRIRMRNYKRMEQYLDSEDDVIVSQEVYNHDTVLKRQDFEYITNLEAVDTALNLVRMQEYNNLPEEKNEVLQQVDEYVDEFDAHDVWFSLEQATDDEDFKQCECGQVVLNGNLCMCQPSNSKDDGFDAYINIEDDQIVDLTYDIVKDELCKLSLGKVQQIVYHPIPWKSVMRGELDPECYLEYSEKELPRRPGELLLCESEGYTFSPKITFSDYFEDQKILVKSSESKTSGLRPHPTYDNRILSLPFMNLPDDITGKASSYEMTRSLVYYDAKFNADMMKLNGIIDWHKFRWIGVMEIDDLNELLDSKNKLRRHREEDTATKKASKIASEPEVVKTTPVQFRPMSNILISTRDPTMPLLTPVGVTGSWNQSRTVYIRQQPQTVVGNNEYQYGDVYYTASQQPSPSSSLVKYTSQQFYPENGYSRVRYYHVPKNIGTVG